MPSSLGCVVAPRTHRLRGVLHPQLGLWGALHIVEQVITAQMSVGEVVGTCVGTLLGTDDGANDGADVGTADGMAEGADVGNLVGKTVGN